MTEHAVTTAVILARGLGSRMRHTDPDTQLGHDQEAAAAQGFKTLIPDSSGRPLVDHLITALADAGIAQVVLVVAPDHSALEQHFEAHPTSRVELAMVVQREARGTADAVLAVESVIGREQFLVMNADNLYPVEALNSLLALDGPGLVAFERDALIRLSGIPAERIAAFATLQVGGDDTLISIVEKPADGRHDEAHWISMNLWRFGPSIFEAARKIEPSPRGELELPGAVTWLLERGERFRIARISAGVFDLSHRADIPAVASSLAERRVAT